MTHDQSLAIYIAILAFGDWNVLLSVIILDKLSKLLEKNEQNQD